MGVSGEEWYTEPVIRILTIALILLSVVFDAAAQTISFPSVATANVPAGPQIKAWLTKPAGEGPFPAVIVLHSCAGVGPHTYAWASQLRGECPQPYGPGHCGQKPSS
jgi:poly(3-hydroxybutyrate) depolymerase